MLGLRLRLGLLMLGLGLGLGARLSVGGYHPGRVLCMYTVP